MIMSHPFDTLDYAKKLASAGVPVPQAELQAQLLGDVLGTSVATPDDLGTLKEHLSNKIDNLELRIDNKMAVYARNVDTRLTSMNGDITLLKWMTGTTIGLLFTVLFKLFLH
ncbi:MAG: hypothetical protein ACI802_000527 [Candidatus Paceibacteria bacterium]|jgi:hypothetical protein